MGYYTHNIDKTLFLFALENDNSLFMKKSLLMGAFDQKIFKDDEVVDCMLEFLDDGCKTNYILNVLLLTEVTLWKNDKI